MIYGLYLSAMGVLANSYRQDVIANNLANAETVGFKRDLALFQERRTEARARGLSVARHSNPLLEPLGGGMRAAPAVMDLSGGELEASSNPLDAAIEGEGFFAIRNESGQFLLTRDGRMGVNASGNLALTSGAGEVLGADKQPIAIKPGIPVNIGKDGSISQGGQVVGRLGVFEVPDKGQLCKRGALMMSYPNAEKQVLPGRGMVQGNALERANVDPTTELAQLMETQRQLEANANMIRYQDQTLGRLVNDVGKIG